MSLRNRFKSKSKSGSKIKHSYLIDCNYLLIASPALHVALAETDSGLRIAGGGVLMGSPTVAAALLASMGSELVVVVLTPIALVARHSRLALALAVAVALQRSGAHGIAGAVDAVAILAHVEVLLAAFAVGTIAILPAVQTVTSMTRQVEELCVEEALVRQSIAVAGYGDIVYLSGFPFASPTLAIQLIRYQFGTPGPIRFVSRL